MKKILVAVPVVAAIVIAGIAQSAMATSNENNCTLVDVSYGNDSTVPRNALSLVCSSGTVYSAYITGGAGNPACPTTSVDTVKLWESMAVAARLSGKVVTVWYNIVNCDGAPSNRIMNSLEIKGN